MPKYKLKEEFFFEDGNSVSSDVLLKELEEDLSSNMVKIETVSESDVKRIFWANKDNLQKI
tara:strand:- start:3410 stop:3592 length:183 start_codon:yes stop_codon:yes gene_type:complete